MKGVYGIPVEDAAGKLGMDLARLKELVDAELIPHFHIDNGPPLLKVREARDWMVANLYAHHGGPPLPKRVDILFFAERAKQTPPVALRNIDRLCEVNLAAPSGIYFLCRDGQVVYVGQAKCVMSRIGQHLSEARKCFDSAYYMVAAMHDLNRLEDKYIELLAPE